MQRGYVKLWRKSIDGGWLSNHKLWVFWCWALIKASHKEFDFFCTHGFGGGTRTEGGSVTKYSKFADRFSCDVVVVGHDHRKQFVRYPVLGISGIKEVKLTARPKLICLGGSWKKSYSDNTSTTWEETKGFVASEIGGITIEIKTDNPSGVKLNATI